MEESIPASEGILGQRKDAELTLESERPLPGTHPLTKDSNSEANNYRFGFGVKKQKIDRADNDVSGSSATGVGEENEKSLEESVFTNHLLLGEIFMHSTFEDLKSHRQLNRLWNLEATKAILKRFALKPIQLLSQGAYLNAELKTCLSLKEFQLLVEQSVIFPCNYFLLASLQDTELNFLRRHGSLIKSLKYQLGPWDMVDESPTGREFLQLLADNLPNLEILILKSCPSSPQIERSSHGETAKELKKLRDLKISSHCDLSKEFLSLLLKSSPNLKNIHLTTPSSLQNLVELNAIYLLNKFRLEIHADFISFYEQIVTQNLKCTELIMNWSRVRSPRMSEADLPKVGRILSEAFRNCSATLQSLSLEIPLGQVPQLQFATCPKVTRLAIHFSNPAYLQLQFDRPIQGHPLPTDFNLEVTFPNLQEFELLFDYFWQVSHFPLFPETSISLLFVRILNIHGPYGTNLSIPTRWLKQFCQLFPNITIASFGTVLDSDFGLISNFRFLEKLEFMICVEETDEDFVRVDSLLTGFSGETVRRIYRQSETGFSVNVKDMEGLGVTDSVANLKNLTELVIIIIPRDCDDEWGEFYTQKDDFVVGSGSDVENPVLKMRRNVTISHVSRKFCFDMCPKLGSNIVVKIHPKWKLGFASHASNTYGKWR